MINYKIIVLLKGTIYVNLRQHYKRILWGFLVKFSGIRI